MAAAIIGVISGRLRGEKRKIGLQFQAMI